MGDTQNSIDNKENEKNDIAPEKGVVPAGKEADKPASLRFFRFWFNRQTRFGRFNRTAVRWLAIIIILFALGLLAGYQFLYKPAQTNNQAIQTQLLTRLDQANNRVQLLELTSQFQAARLYLEKKDFGSAQKVLLDNRSVLVNVKPIITKQDSTMPEILQTLLDQAMTMLASDPVKAANNLDALVKLLLTLEQGMVKSP